MATRPSSVPTFATDSGTRATLTSTRKATGFLPGEVLPALELNAAIGTGIDWVVYLSQLSPLSNVISGDPGLSLVGGTNDAQRIRIGMVDDYFAINHGSGGSPNVTAWFPTSGWIHTRAGHVATVGTVDDGYRYGYSSTVAVSSTYLPSATPLILGHWLTDGAGGWSLSSLSAPSAVLNYDAATRFLVFGHGEAGAVVWHRDLSGVLTGHNAEAKTAGGTVMVIPAIRATIDTALSAATVIELVEQNRTTNAETVVLSLSAPAATAAALYTDTGSTPIDLEVNAYILRTTVGAVGGVAGVKDLKLTTDKYAVE